MSACTRIDDLPWKPHSLAEGVMIKPLVTKSATGADVTCMLVKIPAGAYIPEHVHETQEDIVYPLSGKGKMFVEGTGEFDLAPGIIVRVPKGRKHRVFDVTEELTVFDVFSPALI